MAILVKLSLEKESHYQTDITSFFKKADRSKKNDDHKVTDHAQLPPPSPWLMGWRKHLPTSQTTPGWSVGPLMSVVLPLQIPQRSEVDPSTKAVRKMRATTFKMMKRRRPLLYDFILLYL